MPLALQTTDICRPLQKMLRDPVGSTQTTRGHYDVCSGVQSHKPPSSTSSPPFRPADCLLTGNTDLSTSEGRLGRGSTAGIAEHTSSRAEQVKKRTDFFNGRAFR